MLSTDGSEMWLCGKGVRSWCDGSSDWSFMVHPLSYFSFQPVLHDWCNKGRGMCYPVCGMVHIKEPLLLIDKSSLCGGSGFPLSLSEWSFTICPTPYNRKLSVSLNTTFPSFLLCWIKHSVAPSCMLPTDVYSQCDRLSDRSFLVDLLSYVSFQPVFHDWYNKVCSVFYPVCGMMHIKEPLLLIGKNSSCGGSEFPLSLLEWSLTICLTPYNRK